MKLSVILCTHNPRADDFKATLDGLRAQEAPAHAELELIVVDNASDVPVSAECLRDFPCPARIVREPRLGLTQARLRGFAEASAPLLLLLDDDNVLQNDFVANVMTRFADHPKLGCIGGTILPRFESPAPKKWNTLLSCLALREVQAPLVTDRFQGAGALPYGAGMALRSEVAARYGELVRADPKRRALDRSGGTLTSCGDLDLACCAYDCGYQCGLFPELRLTHRIPASRTDPKYLKALAVHIAASSYLLWKLRGHHKHPVVKLFIDSFHTLLRGRYLRRRLRFLRGSWRAALLGR